jgi:hypothetical protein
MMSSIANFRFAFCLLMSGAYAALAQDVRTPAAQEPSAESTASQETLSPAVSQVRIVRLSQVQGQVGLERIADRGFEPTFTNLPVVQGAKLRTQRGVAEVEFEDNSSLRIVPDTEIHFIQLGRTAAGETMNQVRLIKGTLYVSLTKDKQNDFVVLVGDRTISLPSGSHARLDVYPAGSELVVFKGRAQVTDGNNLLTVGTSKALKFGGPNDAPPLLARDETPGLFDGWDQNATRYHEARVASAYRNSPYAYGAQDLATYGAFSDLAGCGRVWQPYLVSAAWDPYASGVWTYYQGVGYSWVSPYPWAWTPYHSGSWVSCGASGWGWRPDRRWAGLKNPVLFHPINGPRPPGGPKPPHPLARTESSMVVVGADHLHVPSPVAADKLQLTKDSAGLGLPRDAGVKLNRISSAVAARGSVEVQVLSAERIELARANAVTSLGASPHSGRSEAAPAGMAPASRPVAAASSFRGAGGSYAGGRSYSSGLSSSTHAATPSGAGSSASTSVGPSTVSGSSASSTSGGSHH